jgi:hypothetical protein
VANPIEHSEKQRGRNGDENKKNDRNKAENKIQDAASDRVSRRSRHKKTEADR